jgi:uncharacterized NAD-dependent epimerase/dehydratase family protein
VFFREDGMMMGTACIFTNGKLDQPDAKTAHGLIRGTNRFDIIGVVDENLAGLDAGECLDGHHRGIPVYGSIGELIEKTGVTPSYGIIGVAIAGGRLNDEWQTLLLNAMEQGLSIVNGMHMLLNEIPKFQESALRNGVEIIDIRKPKSFDNLNAWTGKIYAVDTPRLAVLGTDCALGKRTTGRLIEGLCHSADIDAQMIYTGQTGWLQGYSYGFILDATLNDFVSSEIETAILQCDREASPDLILIEGQSCLRNPLGPCGAEIVISGNVKGVILQHAPFRQYYDDLAHVGCLLPELQSEIRLMEMYGTRVLAVTLNGEGATKDQLAAYAQTTQEELGIPVIMPLEEGVQRLLPVIKSFMADHGSFADVTIVKGKS